MKPSTVASIVFLSQFLFSTASALEFHPGYTRENPPPSGYWYSDIPGSYNPWTDDIQMTLLEFPASNEGVTSYRDIKMLPEGYSTQYSDGPKMLGEGGSWEFVDLSTQADLLTGTNWVHGDDYEYPADTWVLQFNGEGGFDTYRPGDAAFQLGEYRGIAIEVSNLGDTYLIVDAYSKGMRQWLGQKHGGVIGLEPGDTDIIYYPFRRNETTPPAGTTDFFGCIHHLCGYPGGHLYGLVYSQMNNVSGVVGIQATVPRGTKAGSNIKWSINRIWAGGRYQVPTMEQLAEAGHTAERYADEDFVDDYGQWKYDDWVGKLWSVDDAVEQYQKLEGYLEDYPGPSTWDEWGGWAAPDAPQLEATGWFRVEKYNDRWWFVDPAGRLFLSQGSLHMSANMPRPAVDAGYTQDEYTDDIYLRRLRSMGINTVGGNSSWKWHKGKIPYTYQVKTGLAPIDYTDIQGKGTVEQFEEWMYNFLSAGREYIADPYCIGVVVDNELKISEANNPFDEPVAKIYFRAVRHALDRLAIEVGRPHDPNHDPDLVSDQPWKSPIIMFDPASNGGEWMAHYCDVLSQHRMEGYVPNIHKAEWGKPLGQFTFTMGNLDVGVAHYGLTAFLNQRHRAQGMSNYMARAYAHPQNIAAHPYSYMKTTARPLTEFRMLVNKSDTTDYFLAGYLREMGDHIYRIHMGEDVDWRRPALPRPADDLPGVGSGSGSGGDGSSNDPGGSNNSGGAGGEDDPNGSGNPEGSGGDLDGASDDGCGCSSLSGASERSPRGLLLLAGLLVGVARRRP